MRFFLALKKKSENFPPDLDFNRFHPFKSHFTPQKRVIKFKAWIFPPPSLWWPHVPSNGLRMHADSVGSSLAIPEVLLYWIPLPLHQHPSRKWSTPDLCFVMNLLLLTVFFWGRETRQTIMMCQICQAIGFFDSQIWCVFKSMVFTVCI